VVAITGLGLTIFVIGHLAGNLQVFLGPEVINRYAHFLKENPELLWPVRIVLLVFFVAHVAVAINLKVKNRSARSTGYVYQRHYDQASLASRHMVWTGLVILVFLLYHLAHFTFGWTEPASFQLRRPLGETGPLVQDVYSMVVHSFRQPLIVALYMIAQVFLGLHLAHGVPSMFQTLGINRPRWQRGLETVGLIIAWGVVIGNMAIPWFILLGAIPAAPQPLPPAG
jgi:succinate dehydrogenase / fumarate reductase cytochrome b subunit